MPKLSFLRQSALLNTSLLAVAWSHGGSFFLQKPSRIERMIFFMSAHSTPSVKSLQSPNRSIQQAWHGQATMPKSAKLNSPLMAAAEVMNMWQKSHASRRRGRSEWFIQRVELCISLGIQVPTFSGTVSRETIYVGARRAQVPPEKVCGSLGFRILFGMRRFLGMAAAPATILWRAGPCLPEATNWTCGLVGSLQTWGEDQKSLL